MLGHDDKAVSNGRCSHPAHASDPSVK